MSFKLIFKYIFQRISTKKLNIDGYNVKINSIYHTNRVSISIRLLNLSFMSLILSTLDSLFRTMNLSHLDVVSLVVKRKRLEENVRCLLLSRALA